MTYRERNQWLKYLNDQATLKRERWEWYAARITYFLYVICGVFRRQPQKKEEDFLIEYRIDRPLTRQEQREKALAEKQEQTAYVNKVRLYMEMVRLTPGLNSRKKAPTDPNAPPAKVVIPRGVRLGKTKPPAHFVFEGQEGVSQSETPPQ